MSSNVVALPEGQDRRRRNPFAGGGRHRRTPEAWAEMARENAALKAAKAAAERDLEWSRHEVASLQHQVTEMGTQMRDLLGEVRQMRALMGSDSGQEKVTIIPPSDQEETQPISQAELFADGDTLKTIRPVIRVGTIGSPNPASSEAATALLDRLSSQNSERVRHVDVTEPIPLWDSPLAQQRNTA